MAWPAGRLAKPASGGIQPTTVPLAALAHGSDAAAASRLGLGLANPNPIPNPNTDPNPNPNPNQASPRACPSGSSRLKGRQTDQDRHARIDGQSPPVPPCARPQRQVKCAAAQGRKGYACQGQGVVEMGAWGSREMGGWEQDAGAASHP